MINLQESYVAELGFELAILEFAVIRATDCSMESVLQFFINNIFFFSSKYLYH